MTLDMGTAEYDRAINPTAATNGAAVAEACGLSLAFGGHQVLNGLSFRLPAASVTLLRGENGSGKTTLLNIINGFLKPDKGTFHLNLHGQKIVLNGTSAPERMARYGVGRLWQDIRLFSTMTALDNVLAASPQLAGGNLLNSLVSWPAWQSEERAARERAMLNLETVKMADRAQSSCDMFSVGQMKRVAIARLLQAEAELLLLDEPLASLDRNSARDLLQLISRLREEHHKTMLIVEHQHEQMRPVSDQSLLLENGRLIAQETL